MKCLKVIFCFLVFSLVSCKPSDIRESGLIKYQAKTSTNKSLDKPLAVTIRVKNLNDFDWYVPASTLMDHMVIYDFLVHGKPLDLVGIRDMPFMVGMYEKVGAGQHLERILNLGARYETLSENLKKDSTWFVWSDTMTVYLEKPSIIYGEKPASQIQSKDVKLNGRVLLY